MKTVVKMILARVMELDTKQKNQQTLKNKIEMMTGMPDITKEELQLLKEQGLVLSQEVLCTLEEAKFLSSVIDQLIAENEIQRQISPIQVGFTPAIESSGHD